MRAYITRGQSLNPKFSTVVRHGGDLGPRPRRFFLRVFFFGFFLKVDVSLRTSPLPPLEWLSFSSLVAAVLITPKGTESPGSGRIGVIGALVFLPSEAV